jgi:hypothetical protein
VSLRPSRRLRAKLAAAARRVARQSGRMPARCEHAAFKVLSYPGRQAHVRGPRSGGGSIWAADQGARRRAVGAKSFARRVKPTYSSTAAVLRSRARSRGLAPSDPDAPVQSFCLICVPLCAWCGGACEPCERRVTIRVTSRTRLRATPSSQFPNVPYRTDHGNLSVATSTPDPDRSQARELVLMGCVSYIA